MKYSKFKSLSIKARAGLLQKSLIRHGYDLHITYKLDKETKKCLKDFQKSNQIIPNCVICNKTYDLLDIREEDMYDRDKG